MAKCRVDSMDDLLQTLEIAGMIALAIFIVDAIFRVHIPLSRRNS